MATDNNVTRYSDAELQEFKALIENKMAIAQKQLELLDEQIQDTSESINDDHGGDWVDDSGYNTDIEMLQTMAMRQRKYIQDLDAALIRIRNKTYGICVNSGKLIDKKRLMAVPTTKKSLDAKGIEQKELMKKSKGRPKMPYIKKEKKVVSTVVKKSGSKVQKLEASINVSVDEMDDLGDDMNFDDHIDVENIADESTMDN